MSTTKTQPASENRFKVGIREWEFTVVVTLENALYLGPNNQPLPMAVPSPIFTSTPKGSEIWWTLKITTDAKYHLVSLCLVAQPADVKHVLATYTLDVVNKAGRSVHNIAKTDPVSFQLDQAHNVTFYNLRDFNEDQKKEWLPDGDFTVSCVITAYVPRKTSVIEDHYREMRDQYASDLLKTLYTEELYHDVVLRSGKTEFKCHKSVLSAKSPFFKALFNHDMKENQDREADLSETMNEVELRDLLNFVYLGTAANLDETCVKLYEVSEMYGGFEALQTMCRVKMLERVCPENAVEMLNFALKFNIASLKKSAAECIAKNS